MQPNFSCGKVVTFSKKLEFIPLYDKISYDELSTKVTPSRPIDLTKKNSSSLQRSPALKKKIKHISFIEQKINEEPSVHRSLKRPYQKSPSSSQANANHNKKRTIPDTRTIIKDDDDVSSIAILPMARSIVCTPFAFSSSQWISFKSFVSLVNERDTLIWLERESSLISGYLLLGSFIYITRFRPPLPFFVHPVK